MKAYIPAGIDPLTLEDRTARNDWRAALRDILLGAALLWAAFWLLVAWLRCAI